MKKNNISQKLYIPKELQEIIKEYGEKCVDCKQCMIKCPMLNDFCNSPKKLLQELAEGDFDAILPYSCALCDWCSEVCPKGIDFKKIFYSMRKDVAKNHTETLKKVRYGVVKYHQKNSFSKIFTANHQPLSKRDDGKVKKVFLPGCSLASYSPMLVMKTYEYLRNNFNDMGIILKCCGKPTYDMGDVRSFENYFNSLEQDIEAMGATEVIVACENCYKTLSENYKRGKVKSLWSVMAEKGVPEKVKGIYSNLNYTFSLHDPCSIRDEKEIHESVRFILNEIGIKNKEFKFSKDKTSCCGFGGMIGVTNSDISKAQMKKRASEAEGDYIVSYCQSCVEAMNVAGKESVHILDLIFNEQVIEENIFKQKDIKTINKWINRYKLKKIIASMK